LFILRDPCRLYPGRYDRFIEFKIYCKYSILVQCFKVLHINLCIQVLNITFACINIKNRCRANRNWKGSLWHCSGSLGWISQNSGNTRKLFWCKWSNPTGMGHIYIVSSSNIIYYQHNIYLTSSTLLFIYINVYNDVLLTYTVYVLDTGFNLIDNLFLFLWQGVLQSVAGNALNTRKLWGNVILVTLFILGNI
jgi:hypothetical protein